MTEWLGRDLSALDLGVLMIDGVHIDKHVMLVALGIDADGKKHVPGVREGTSENAAACTALLADLRDRGLIENLMGSVRRLSHRVKRWRGGKMIVRWTVAAVADAATRFRRVTGAREGMTPLMRALAQHGNSTTAATPRTKAAA